jgi:DNA-binding NarL/FixJ family response regulator
VSDPAGEAARASIRILLVDDHAVLRLGLRTLVAADPSMEVVGEAADGAAALEACARLRPDVVVMDLVMEGVDGVAATREIARRHPETRVLVLTMHEEEDYLIPLLEAGASGYIVKEAASADLLDAVRTVAAGRTFVRPAAARVLAEGWTRRNAQAETRARYDALSEREREVFRLMAEGYTSTQIGERLFISAKTVDTYRRRINEKLGVADRAAYIRLALELGLLGGK